MARKKPKKYVRKKGQPGTAVRVKGHTRGPRAGKHHKKGNKAVYVQGYRRREPRR